MVRTFFTLYKGYPEGCVDSIGMLLYSLDSLKGFFIEKCGKDYSKVKCKKYIPNVKHCVSFLTLSKMSQEFEKIKTEKETNLSKLNDLQSLQKFLTEHLTIKLNDVIKDGTCLDFIATGLFYIPIFLVYLRVEFSARKILGTIKYCRKS